MLQRFRSALKTLWPLLVTAAILQAVERSVIANNGFFAQIYGLQWPPAVRQLTANFIALLWGGFGAALAGTMVADLGIGAIVTAAVAMVLVQSDITAPTLSWPEMGLGSLLLALLVAEGIALGSRFLKPHWLRIAAGMGLLAAAAAIGYWLPRFNGLAAIGNDWLRLPLVIGMAWSGLSDLQFIRADLSSTADALANLQAALAGTSLYAVPKPYSLYTLYAPFGAMGGAGMALALVCALWLVQRRLPLAELVTTSVNLPALVWLRLPIFLDWHFLIPMLLAPAASMGIAAGAIALKWMPPVVYTVPPTTPGLLFAFLGTNGNWVALGISVLCLLVSTAIYWPFVQRRLAHA